MRASLPSRLRHVALLMGAAACSVGTTDVPDIPLTQPIRIEVVLAGDSLLLGDTVQASARGFTTAGEAVPLTDARWVSADTGVLSVTDGGVLRARNLGTVWLDVNAAGIVGSRRVRVVSRAYRVSLSAPDSVELVDDVRLTSRVVTAAGTALPEVAPRLASSDSSIARVTPLAVGTARVLALRTGSADLLAIIGGDTTRKRLVVRVTPLRALDVTIGPRIVALGDSVPFALTAVDTLGRTAPSGAYVTSIEPAGLLSLRNGHLVGLTAGRAIVTVTNGAFTARDTLTVQGPSEFQMELLDGNPQNPLPAKVRASMDRVALKWRTVIRASPPGEFVRLNIGECRNAVPVANFISGVRVLIKLDTLAPRIAGQGGPCAVRANGLPLLGTISLNILNYNTLSDRKLDDLIQHEVGHVLGIGTIWNRGPLATLVDGDSSATDPIFIGRSALAAFPKLGQSARFAGRPIPLQVSVRGHWRGDAFLGEVMAPALINADQPTSAVTVAALRDLGWTVELEAYEEFTLPEAVLQRPTGVTARVLGTRTVTSALTVDGDVLLPKILVRSGENFPIDPVTGRVRFR